MFADTKSKLQVTPAVEEEMRQAHKSMQEEVGAALGGIQLVISLLEQPSLTEELSAEALKLGVRLLEFGNKANQQAFLGILRRDISGKFLTRVQRKLRLAKERIKKRKKAVKTELERARREGERLTRLEGAAGGGEAALRHRRAELNAQAERNINATQEYSTELELVCRMLQLLCEGHNRECQDFLRTQKDTCRVSVDVITEVTSIFSVLAKDARTISQLTGTREITWMACILNFLTETVQGPDESNQELIANTPIVRNLSCILGTEFSRVGET
jgi:hypothetical protein